jgi:hypothetical protein
MDGSKNNKNAGHFLRGGISMLMARTPQMRRAAVPWRPPGATFGNT